MTADRLASPPQEVAKRGPIDILTINIRAGGGKRIDRICRFIESLSPDVGLLTEYRGNGAGARLRDALRASGLEWQVAGVEAPGVNSLLLVSRIPFETRPLPALLAPYGQRLVYASLPTISVLGVYLPPKRAKRPLFQALVDASPELLSGPAILLGDLNTGRHFVDEPGATFVTADLFVALEKQGWVDAWRRLHPDVRESSWFSSKGNGFRLDHVFLSRPLVPLLHQATYHHEPRADGTTDHSGLSVRLDQAG